MKIYYVYRTKAATTPDEALEFVVAADNEADAREQAAEEHGTEGPEFWFDTAVSEVWELGPANADVQKPFIVQSYLPRKAWL